MMRLTAAALVLAMAAGVRAADGDEKKPGARPGFGGGNLVERMFKRLDADGNGKLTRDEVKNAGQGRLNVGEVIGKAFDKLDADKSGDLSADEFKKFGE